MWGQRNHGINYIKQQETPPPRRSSGQRTTPQARNFSEAGADRKWEEKMEALPWLGTQTHEERAAHEDKLGPAAETNFIKAFAKAESSIAIQTFVAFFAWPAEFPWCGFSGLVGVGWPREDPKACPYVLTLVMHTIDENYSKQREQRKFCRPGKDSER